MDTHLGDPLEAQPGQRVSPGLLAEQTTAAGRALPWVAATTTATVTSFGVESRWRVEVVHDGPRHRQHLLTVVDDEPRQELVVIGSTAWEWRAGEAAHSARPFAEEVLAGPVAPLADLALEAELETEVVFLEAVDVELSDEPCRLWRFAVLDGRARDADHTTAQYTVEVDADRVIRRVVVPAREARSEAVTELRVLPAEPAIDEPLGRPHGARA